MKFEICSLCKKFKYTPYQVTDVDKNGNHRVTLFCETCGKRYLESALEDSAEVVKEEDGVDLSHIETPEQLLDFLNSLKIKKDDRPPCQCGWTLAEFEAKGRMGCPKCYEHFADRVQKIVFPYHGADHHVGKRPKLQTHQNLLDDPVEKLKLLKLQYAKAMEIENYEWAAKIKKELDSFTGQSPPKTCGDQ